MRGRIVLDSCQTHAGRRRNLGEVRRQVGRGDAVPADVAMIDSIDRRPVRFVVCFDRLTHAHMPHDAEKEVAARASLRFVRDGAVVGLGSGSTATDVLRLLGERIRAGLKILGIPTSRKTAELAAILGIPLTTFDQIQEIDVTIDGADEFDPQLSLIKGGGGALLHEKVVASASRQVVIVTDSSKQVPVLGMFPLPVEVIAFAESLVKKRIEALGASVVLRQSNGRPFVTDEGHHMLDCSFGQIPDPPSLALRLNDMPGIVEHGLFIGIATVILVAKGNDVTELKRDNIHRRPK